MLCECTYRGFVSFMKLFISLTDTPMLTFIRVLQLFYTLDRKYLDDVENTWDWKWKMTRFLSLIPINYVQNFYFIQVICVKISFIFHFY